MNEELYEEYRKTFAGKLKKHLVLRGDSYPLFNPGACRDEHGTYHLFVRVSSRHKNYTSWIAHYESTDGVYFQKRREFFLYPPYTLRDYIFGFEDDRCSRYKGWTVHTHTVLLAKDLASPSRDNFTDYIGVSLGKRAEEAKFVGIVNVPDDKDAALVGDRPWLIHRPSRWGEPASIWYGDFSKGMEEAIGSFDEQNVREVKRLSPPEDNRLLLAPLPEWNALKIGFGAPPLRLGKGEYLVTIHVRSIPFQYWLTAGIMEETESGLRISKILPFPLCVPDTPWELIGDVPKVCFICGLTLNNGNLEGWYGASDTHVMKFSIHLDYLVNIIENRGVDPSDVNQQFLERNKDILEKVLKR